MQLTKITFKPEATEAQIQDMIITLAEGYDAQYIRTGCVIVTDAPSDALADWVEGDELPCVVTEVQA